MSLDWEEDIKWCRYILVHRLHRTIEYTAPTISELWEQLSDARRDAGGLYTYYVGQHELVDLWDEPGRITYSMESYGKRRRPVWEPGTMFHDDDHMAIRFRNMELQ